MAALDQGLYSLNAGEVSTLALARVDLKKLQVACEVQSNFLPRVLGPCELRPGTEHFDTITGNQKAKFIEFYFDEATTDLLVLTPGFLEVFTTGAFITRAAVTAAIVNGTFATDLSGWTNSDEAGAVSAWDAAPAMSLVGTGTNFAMRDQSVTVHESGVEHALNIEVGRGTVILQVGTAAGDTTYLEAILREGSHSLSFVPSGNFWIRLGASARWASLVNSVAIAAAGRMLVATPWQAGDLPNIFYDQSQDVIFAACLGVQQQRIERRSQRSWSVVRYYADDGPFRLPNLSEITLAPSGLTGSVTLTASRSIFNPGHVRALFQLTHQGQRAFSTLAGNDQYTDPVRVAGLKALRDVGITVAGTFSATVTLQQSIAVVGSWTPVKTYTGPTDENYNDGLDNQVIFYRLGIKGGDYSSGSADATLLYAGSIQVGVCRVTDFVDSQTVLVSVLANFSKVDPTTNWAEGVWSAYRGWPTSLAFHDGRLFQGGQSAAIYGSVADAFASYDASVIGDAGPIDRTITSGGADGVRWLMSLQRLLCGTAAQEVSIRSDAFDAPLTPTAFVARNCSTRGAARVRPLKVDTVGVFVCRDAKRIFKLVVEVQFADYRAHELTRLKQEMCEAGVVDCAVQRHPDTRLWFVLADGTCAVLTYDEEDDVAAWTPFVTQGAVEAVAVLPGGVEDVVYFSVARHFPDGSTVRFLEVLAWRIDCQAGPWNRTSDCHYLYDGAPTNTIPVPWLKGAQVTVWADGAARCTYPGSMIVVDGSGNANIPGPPVSIAVVGLPYTGKLKTAKLAYGAERGTALTMTKKVARVGLVLANVPWQGLKLGRSLDQLTSLPATYRGRPLENGEVLIDYDDVPGPFNGGWNPDSRVCIEVSSPYSATIMGLVVDMDTNEPNVPTPPPRGNGG